MKGSSEASYLFHLFEFDGWQMAESAKTKKREHQIVIFDHIIHQSSVPTPNLRAKAQAQEQNAFLKKEKERRPSQDVPSHCRGLSFGRRFDDASIRSIDANSASPLS